MSRLTPIRFVIGSLILTLILLVVVVVSTQTEFTLPNSPIARLSSVTGFTLSSYKINPTTNILDDIPIIIALPQNSTTPQPFTLQLQPELLFGDELSIQFLLGSLSFDLLLFKSTPFLNPSTSVIINGQHSPIENVGEIDFQGDRAHILTYTSHYNNQDNQPSYATFTFSLSNTRPVDDITTAHIDESAIPQWKMSIGGTIMDGPESYHIEPIQIHNYFIVTDRYLTNALIREEEYRLQSYDTGADNYNATDHMISTNTLESLIQDQALLQNESDRLKLLNQTTSQSLLAWKLSDVQSSGEKACSELHMPGRRSSTGSGQTVETFGNDEDDDTVDYGLDEIDQTDQTGANDDISAKTHEIPSSYLWQRSLILPRSSSNGRITSHRTHSHNHDLDYDHHHANLDDESNSDHDDDNSTRHNAHEIPRTITNTHINSNNNPTPSQPDMFDHEVPVAPNGNTNGSSSNDINNTPDEIQFDQIRSRINTFFTQAISPNPSLSSQPLRNRHSPILSPLSMRPQLSRWNQCHTRSKLLTGLKVNFLISVGAAITMTGVQNPSASQVLTSFQTLITQANGPLIAQLGFYIIPSYINIMTQSNTKLQQSLQTNGGTSTTKLPEWNYDVVTNAQNGCPDDASQIIPIVKAVRDLTPTTDPSPTTTAATTTTTTFSENGVPPAALTHLLHSCYASGVIGQGYVGAVRTRNFSVGWTSVRSKDPTWVTILHEISHGLGGVHPWGSNNQLMGKFGGVMDYNKPEGTLLTGPYAGSVGFNMDTDFGTICTTMKQNDNEFWTDDLSLRPDLFSMAESFDLSPYTWICSPEPIVSGDIIFYLDETNDVWDEDYDANFGPNGEFSANNSQNGKFGSKLGHIDPENPTHHYVSNCDTAGVDSDVDITFQPCSKDCGQGSQLRYVVCANTSQTTAVPDFSSSLSIVNSDNCLAMAPSPPKLKSCFGVQCNPTTPTIPDTPDPVIIYSWKCATTSDKFPSTPANALNCATSDGLSNPSTWSICNAECGTGVQTRVTKCASSTGEWVDDTKCTSALQTPPKSVSCTNLLNCIYSWQCGDSNLNLISANQSNTGTCEGLAYFIKNSPIPTTSAAIKLTICSDNCGTVETHRAVLCVQNGRFSPDSVCSSISQSKPPMTQISVCATCPSKEPPETDPPTIPTKPVPNPSDFNSTDPSGGNSGNQTPDPTNPTTPGGTASNSINYCLFLSYLLISFIFI